MLKILYQCKFSCFLPLGMTIITPFFIFFFTSFSDDNMKIKQQQRNSAEKGIDVPNPTVS